MSLEQVPIQERGRDDLTTEMRRFFGVFLPVRGAPGSAAMLREGREMYRFEAPEPELHEQRRGLFLRLFTPCRSRVGVMIRNETS